MKPHYSRDLPAARLAQLAPGADGHPREDGDQQRAPGAGAGPRPPAHIERYIYTSDRVDNIYTIRVGGGHCCYTWRPDRGSLRPGRCQGG